MRALGLKTTRNAVYQTASHAVWIPTYRTRVVSNAVADGLRGLLSDVAHAKGFEILALEIQPDHIHLLFSAPPAIAPSLAIQWFKGISARSLSAEFASLRRVLRRATSGRRRSTWGRPARCRPRRSGAPSSAPRRCGRGAE